MEWDAEAKRGATFDLALCPLAIRRGLAGLELNCLVV
jgi:hypothetical protein